MRVRVQPIGQHHVKGPRIQRQGAASENPTSGNILNTLGVAQDRLGRYGDALATLKHSDELSSKRTKGSLPADVAFIAMSLYHLDKKGEAGKAFERLRRVMSNPKYANDEEAQALLKEAEALIGGGAPTER